MSPVLVARVLMGAAVVCSTMGRAGGSSFLCKRNFLGLAGLAKVEEGPGGEVFRGSTALCSDCGCFW